MKPSHSQFRRRFERQRGAVLFITLIMLLLITIVSMSTVRSTITDERMAGNARDRDKAFQAAEAAVRDCLSNVQDSTYEGTNPTLLTPASTGDQVWDIEQNWDSSSLNSRLVSVDADGLAEQPRCMLEELGAGSGSYRITGRAVGAQTQTVVMVQATYTTE